MKGICNGASFELTPAEEYLVRATQARLKPEYGELELVIYDRSEDGQRITIYLRRTPKFRDSYDVVFRHDQYGAFLIRG